MTEYAEPTTDTGQSATPRRADAPENRARNRLVIAVLLVSAFIVILNETIMGVAIPHLMADLDITATAAQWLSTAFMLTMAVVIPITGFLLERFSTRSMFITAMTLFSLGTLIAASAPGFPVLLAGRIVQATGTAIMMPLLMTTVMTLVAPAARGRVMGNISIVISVAPAIGPTISGFILSVLDWRWMFIIVLPIALAGLFIGGRLITNISTPRAARIDVFSVVLSVFGFGGLVYGLSSLGGDSSVEALPVWASFIVGALALAAFIARQLWLQRTDRALLDLRTFRSRVFTFSIVMMAVSMMTLFGAVILLPIYTQNVLGLDALSTGLLLLPGGLVMGLLAPIVGRLYDKVGPRILLVPGVVVVNAALWSFTMLDESSPVVMVLIAHITLSVGLAFLFTPLFTASLGSVVPRLYAHGSAVIGTVQQVAGAAGTALFVTVMTGIAMGLAQGDVPDVAQTAQGIRAAFTYGAVISLLAIPAAFFIRREATTASP